MRNRSFLLLITLAIFPFNFVYVSHISSPGDETFESDKDLDGSAAKFATRHRIQHSLNTMADAPLVGIPIPQETEGIHADEDKIIQNDGIDSTFQSSSCDESSFGSPADSCTRTEEPAEDGNAEVGT